ncbi:MAG: nucleotide sugar dehydrogenase [Sulfolobales archaeon]
MRKIAVIGLGNIGLPNAVFLSGYVGYKVIGIDIDQEKIDRLKQGKVDDYISNEDVKKYFYEAYKKNLLELHSDYSVINDNYDIDFYIIHVNAPFSPLGAQQDLAALYSALNSIIKNNSGDESYKKMRIMIRTTLLPGTMNIISRYIKKIMSHRNISLTYVPEFAREHSVFSDLITPHRIVIGCEDEISCSESREFFEEIYVKKLGQEISIHEMSFTEAELTKYLSNIFLALKISYANMIAAICERLKCDSYKIAEALGSDPRIGRKYLTPGLGFGGPCLPRDLASFIFYLTELDMDQKLKREILRLYRSIFSINKWSIDRVVELVSSLARKDLIEISVIGVAYAPGSDDVRNSPSIELIKKLLRRGYLVKIFDPIEKALINAKKILGDSVMYCKSLEECADADIMIIATDLSKYDINNLINIFRSVRDRIVIDAKGSLHKLKSLLQKENIRIATIDEDLDKISDQQPSI